METQKKCEVCGEVKSLSDFSKSYRNRCKACVAQQTKQKRMQKVLDDAVATIGDAFSELDKQQEAAIWEKRRYEIAKEVLPFMWLDDGMAQRMHEAEGHKGFEYKRNDMLAKEAVQLTDALIAELKKGGSE